jgi:hypothetical protein
VPVARRLLHVHRSTRPRRVLLTTLILVPHRLRRRWRGHVVVTSGQPPPLLPQEILLTAGGIPMCTGL